MYYMYYVLSFPDRHSIGRSICDLVGAVYYLGGLEVSYNIMVLTDAVSFLRRACGAQVAGMPANDCSPPRSLPLHPIITATYIP